MGLSYAEIQDSNGRALPDGLPPLNISILRNIMLEPVEPYLRYLAYEMGFNARVRFGGYDNIFQEAVRPQNELFGGETDCVLVFMRLEPLSGGLSRRFAVLDASERASEAGRIKGYVREILQGIRRQTNALILWHGFELPQYPALGALDAQNPDGQLGVITGLNEDIKSMLREDKNAYFVDANLCLSRLGSARFYDMRYWHIGRAPYSREALREIAIEDFRFIRALKGRGKKCLVLDCDNVLWGGIAGEDGLSGIRLSNAYPGSPYYEFQQEVCNLYSRGILIALCSKNNEDDVWEVFRKHPDMVLKEVHIAAYRINWGGKAANIREISEELNIGLDSMVFADDSEFEIGLVRQALPEVETLYLPKSGAVWNRDILASCGLFDTLAVSEEDKRRGEMYRAEAGRRRLKAGAADIMEYYGSLEMELDIGYADGLSIPRIAQLTQKTNQFNLTTKRYSEADISTLAKGEKSDVVYLRLKDRFGDSGIAGAGILRYCGEDAVIDTFLLSCRVLGRGIESAFLSQIMKLAFRRGCKTVTGKYLPTGKNSQTVHFYLKEGFLALKTAPAGSRFSYELAAGIKSEPEFFKAIRSEFDTGQEA